MKILVIHPWDKTTRELKKVYEGYDADFLTKKGFMPKDVEEKLKNNRYDRIYLLGHGDPYGLIDMKNGSYIFGDRFYKLYIEGTDTELVCIFCNADAWVIRNHACNAFATGMFISEQREAAYYGISESKAGIRRGFVLFCDVLHELVLAPLDQFKKTISEKYVGTDPVTKFNRNEMMIYG